MQTRLSRTEVPVESTWDLSDLFADEAAWEAEYRAVDEARAALGVFQGQLGAGADKLLACLNALESLQTRLMRVASFAHLRNAQDGTHPPYQGAMARVAAPRARADASTAFVDAETLAFPEGLLEQFMASEPGLAPFKLMLDDLLELRHHRLGADTERVLAALGEVLNAPYPNATRRVGLVLRRPEGLPPDLRRHVRDRGQQERRAGAAAQLPR